MISLPHGCWMSDPSVNPKNWKQTSASTSKNWYIQYYFHDPHHTKAMLRIIKGMNRYKTPAERRDATQILIDDEIRLLKEDGYNPITKTFKPEELDPEQSDIDPKTPFIQALKIAKASLQVVRTTKADIKSVLEYTEAVAVKFRFDKLPIIEIRKKHIKKIMIGLSQSKKIWNANQFNHYRRYLGMLFKELMDFVDLEYNPALALKKQVIVKRARLELTKEERKKVDEYLKPRDYNFWRLTHIFFHSGARETELMKVRENDVDLPEQMHKVTILKGKDPHEAWKPIKDIALDLWKEIMSEAKPGQYLFSRGFKPGDNSMGPRNITRRWNKLVKKELGIKADFYSLKHSNLDEIEEQLNITEAQKNADHSTPVITMNTYTKGAAKRKLKKLIKASNAFV